MALLLVVRGATLGTNHQNNSVSEYWAAGETGTLGEVDTVEEWQSHLVPSDSSDNPVHHQPC